MLVPQGSWSADVASQHSCCQHLGGNGGSFLSLCWPYGDHSALRASPSVFPLPLLSFLSNSGETTVGFLFVCLVYVCVLAKMVPAWKWERNVKQPCKAPGLTTRAQIAQYQMGGECCAQGLEPAEKALEFY